MNFSVVISPTAMTEQKKDDSIVGTTAVTTIEWLQNHIGSSDIRIYTMGGVSAGTPSATPTSDAEPIGIASFKNTAFQVLIYTSGMVILYKNELFQLVSCIELPDAKYDLAVASKLLHTLMASAAEIEKKLVDLLADRLRIRERTAREKHGQMLILAERMKQNQKREQELRAKYAEMEEDKRCLRIRSVALSGQLEGLLAMYPSLKEMDDGS